jgi:hypothetical protein
MAAIVDTDAELKAFSDYYEGNSEPTPSYSFQVCWKLWNAAVRWAMRNVADRRAPAWTGEAPTTGGVFWFVGDGVVRNYDKPPLLIVDDDALVVCDLNGCGSWLASWSGRWCKVGEPPEDAPDRR